MEKNIKQLVFNAGNNEEREYKLEAIWDSVIYAKEFADYLPGLCYLVF